MANQLELHDVTVRYGEFAAARNVSLTLDQGQIGCLLGPSGCGKTTLLRAIAGFEPIASGEIRLHGNLMASGKHSLQPEQRKVGMVFQDFALFPHLDVRRNIGFGLANLDRGERRQRVDELLQLVDLAGYADSWPHELSGGQQQRVALARSLATSPETLLLDEPFSALDAFTRSALQDEVSRIARQEGLSMVMVTHDIEEAVAMADRVLIMAATPGRIVGELRVELPFPRIRSAPEFSRQRERLMTRFEQLVGGNGEPEAKQTAEAERSKDRQAA